MCVNSHGQPFKYIISMHTLPPLTPELNVRNIQKSLNFYVNLLGFSIYQRPEEGFAAIVQQWSLFDA